MIAIKNVRRGVRAVVHNMVLGMSYMVHPARFASREVVGRIRKGMRGDLEALQQDWQRVGRDMQAAIHAFEQEVLEQ